MLKKTIVLVMSSIFLAVVLTACKGSDSSDSPLYSSDSPLASPQEPDLVETLAPIDSVEITIAESWPPQYFLRVQSGLPNGCTEFERYEVTRQEAVVKVAVFNTVQKGQACTEEYRTVEHNIPLGSDFEPGAAYTVRVNKVTKMLVAQGGAVDIGPLSARLDNPFQLQPGQTASMEAQELSVEFVEVVEDSRCPQGVLCTWAGQALILVHISGNSGDQELTLQLGPKDSVAGAYEGYLFKLLALDPYPQAPEQDAPPQPPYTATLLVSQ